MGALEIDRRGLDIPFMRLGNVTSDDLFEPREQAVFTFYERHRDRYRHALDVGANIGIHTILMAKQGWRVMAFEPDPAHYAALLENIRRNDVGALVVPYEFALAPQAGEAEFVRVLGNTTASHLAGARGHYGAVERFQVKCIAPEAYFESVDFVKMDCEGMEAALVERVRPEHDCEFMIEVSSPEAAYRIYYHFLALGRRMWAQNTGWGPVRSLSDMPWQYTHGHLFVGDEP